MSLCVLKKNGVSYYNLHRFFVRQGHEFNYSLEKSKPKDFIVSISKLPTGKPLSF
jgi:hypothetical protein